MNEELLDRAFHAVRARWPEARPAAGLLLGSGWSEASSFFAVRGELDYQDLPALGRTHVTGHPGRLLWAVAGGVETLVFQGRRHWYEGEGWTPVAAPVYLLRRFDAGILCITNAAGGIRPGLRPGDLLVVEDHLNHMHANPLVGPHRALWGPRFPDQSAVYDRGLIRRLESVAAGLNIALSRGVYVAVTGPVYETPAEIRAFRNQGADAVGMSTVPEAMLASAAGLRVAALSCISNLAAGTGPDRLDHHDVTAAARAALEPMRRLLAGFWETLGDERS